MQPRFPTLGIGKLRIRTRLAFIVSVLTLPLLVLSFMQHQVQEEAIGQASAETAGMDFIAAIMPFLGQVQKHQILSQRVSAGEPGSGTALEEARTEADAAFNELERVAQGHNRRFGTGQIMTIVRDGWQEVRRLDAASDSRTNNALHETLVRDGIVPLLRNVSDAARLNQDPEIASSHAISALTRSLPRLTQALSEARISGAEIFADRSGPVPSLQERLALATWLARARVEAEALDEDLQSAMAADPAYRRALQPLLERSRLAADAFGREADGAALRGMTGPGGAIALSSLGGEAVEATNGLVAAAQQVLEDDFDERRTEARRSQMIANGAALCGIALALALALITSATIVKPLDRLAATADRISLGELDVEIDVTGEHEIGMLAESLRRMQASLGAAIERLKARRAAA